jgi:Tol biopolymer transport system component
MPSPYGILRIFNSADASQIASFENVTEFDLTATGAVFVNFYPNDDGEATEVAITTWDGTVDVEVTSLVAEEENRCYYTSSSIAEVSAGLMSVMGYRCDRGSNTDTQWQLYLIDPANRTAQLEVSENTYRYFVFSDTNAIFPSPDGNSIFFTLPDGVTNQSVMLYATSVSDIAPTQILDRSGIMPAVSDLPYDANNAVAQVSPDGRYLAMTVNTPDNSANLHVYDLSDASLQPIVLDAGDPGDTVASMVFSANSDRLYYVAGTDQGGNNSLFALDLTTGAESRIRRGRYAQMVLSPDGSTLAAMNWVEFDPEEDRYLTLEVIDVASTVPTVIYVGGEVDAEGKLANPSFAYPLSWRRG